MIAFSCSLFFYILPKDYKRSLCYLRRRGDKNSEWKGEFSSWKQGKQGE